MVYAVACALLFAVSMLFATRSTRAVGVERATLARILIAAAVLGAWVVTLGAPLPRAAVGWLLASGAIGMGLGDIVLFQAIPLIGGRLTAVLAQCLSVPFALAIEWCWLHTVQPAAHGIGLAAILAGVLLSLAPDRDPHRTHPVAPQRYRLGVALGVLGALCTALGAVLTRRACECLAAGASWDGGSAAFWRMAAGAVITLCWYTPLLRHWTALCRPGRLPVGAARRYGPTLLNALCGSVLGMVAMQRALAEVPAGIVLAVAATAPIGTMLLLAVCDQVFPRRRAVFGGCLAVAGVVALHLL